MTNQLTRQAFEHAEAFILDNATTLHQARFRYHFKGEDNRAVLQALSDYQNVDGGFGHGLESDLRTQNSSVELQHTFWYLL